ncbi:hypothetical protein [Dyella sp.]|uniref:hypothetical protein n=1 Tax=Dyella sp. TaxID=1869338 RepID=UPI00283D5ABB|nr:hypothetical protein [Dyella sp.]MDR3446673.1 hypothetical protein [Dyella sp.]
MDRQLDVKLKPFSLRHRALVAEGRLPDLSPEVRHRLWRTLSLLNEPYGYSTPDNPGWIISSTDLEQIEPLYRRLLGVPLGSDDGGESFLEAKVLNGDVAAVLNVLECFCAWIERERLLDTQRVLNDTFRDYATPWRLSDGQAFLVDNDYLEDEVLAGVSPMLALANFQGASAEFQRARNALLDGNARDAIFYAGASVESVFKAALPSGGSSKVGVDLVQAYANADLLDGLPKPKAQAIQRALIPTAVLRNELAGHGHGAEVLHVPVEYAELAVNLAATINTFITRQHLRRFEASLPPETKTVAAADGPSGGAATTRLDDDDIPF